MLKPALLYFVLTFAAGFVLGSIRVLLVAPRIGEVAAVLIECPVILLASFLIARFVLSRFAPTAKAGRRLMIGLLAFAMLIIAEMTMAWLQRTPPQDYLAALFKTPGAIGLTAQALFALIPLFIKPRAARQTVDS